MSDTGTNHSGPLLPPDDGGTGTGGVPPPQDDNNNDNWRSDVLQSYRNAEVREIAKVLASLEGPNTTSSSKLMLAMRFEDQIFKSANSLADYRKKLAKRLKKVQKNYTPPAGPTGGSGGPSSSSSSLYTNEDEKKRQELLLTLRRKYGPALRYIIMKAPAALRDIESKLGSDDADLARQHTDNCTKWGRELGVWTQEDDKILLQQEQSIMTTSTGSVQDQQEGTDAVVYDKSTSPTETSGKDMSERSNKKDDDDDDDDKSDKDDSKEAITENKTDVKAKDTATTSTTTTVATPTATATPSSSTSASGTSKPVGSNESSTRPPAMLSLSQLQRMEQHLEKRVENIRTYVAKHADPDLFLLERLVKMDEEISTARNMKANRLMTVNLSKRIEYLQQKGTGTTDNTTNTNNNNNSNSVSGIITTAATTTTTTTTTTTSTSPLVALQQALEKAQAAVPPPTRNDSKRTEATLRYVDKMRAASTAFMNYWTIRDDRVTTAPRQTLQKLQAVINEGSDFVKEAMKARRLEEEKSRGGGGGGSGGGGQYPVLLQDAWAKTLEPPDQDMDTTSSIVTSEDGPPTKKLKSDRYAPVYKARLVLHPNRKTPPALLDALKRKGARLMQRSSNNNKAIVGGGRSDNNQGRTINTSYLELDFGSAFTMTIYLSPLVVIIRAMAPPKDGHSTGVEGMMTTTPEAGKDGYRPIVWKPLSYGLTGSNPSGNPISRSSSVVGVAGGTTTAATTTSSSTTPPRTLSVWGVSGSYDVIGRVVEARLQDASTQATRVLRRCFQSHVKDKTIDFEVEILEGSALLEFLQIARRTYMPGWQDYDP